jgi:hypothetical protein
MEGIQAEGVTQGTEQPQVGAEDSSPESIETGGESQSSEGSQESQAQRAGDKEINFKKMRESVNRLESERAQWLAEKEKLQTAAEIERLLRADPRGGLKQLAQALNVDIKTLIEAQKESDIPQINFEQYEPETAKLLKFLHDRASKVEQLEQWKGDFERRIEESQKQSEMSRIQQNTTSLDQRFADDMVKHGFLDKDGNGDMDVVDLISEAVLSKLSKKGDPRLASVEDYNKATEQVLKSLSSLKNKTLQTTVTKSVPASGSRNGSATTAKPAVTREQRIAMLEDMAKSNTNWGFSS